MANPRLTLQQIGRRRRRSGGIAFWPCHRWLCVSGKVDRVRSVIGMQVVWTSVNICSALQCEQLQDDNRKGDFRRVRDD